MNKAAHLFFLLQTASHFLFRSWRSTGVLAFMILTATGTLVFLSALATGTSDAMIRNSVGLYSGHISGFDLDGGIAPASLLQEGVRSVLKRDVCAGYLSKGENTQSVQLTGIVPADEKRYTGLWTKTLEGRFLTDQDKGLYVGVDTAKFLGVHVGDALFFRPHKMQAPTSYPVIGIFRTGLTEFDGHKVFCHISQVPCTPDRWNAAVFLEEGTAVAPLLSHYVDTTRDGGTFSAWYDLMPDLDQLIGMNKICMGILTIIVFTIVSIGVSCAFIIFILKNLREYGIMKSMGLSTAETVFLIFSEVFILVVCASVAGVVAGTLAVHLISGTGIDISSLTSHNRYFIMSGMIYPRLTAVDLFFPPLMSLVFCMVAAVWPAYTVSTSKIAEVMRSI